MTALRDILLRRIRATGPITVADYMGECLLHPQHGYYSTRDPLGAAGDFTTAPEISQMFGELLGLCLAQCWLEQGAPAPFVLAELGPGRGTLMADMLRATRKVPGFHAALRLHLIEASPALRARQAETLAAHAPQWHDHLADLPDLPLFLLANEFFDALPVRQFLRAGQGWRERMVGVEGEDLVFGLGPVAPLEMLDHRLADTAEGDLVELCPAAQPIMHELGARIARHGQGAALIVDYGDWRSLGDTLQALRAHRPDPPLAHPGEADLTAHVDFEALAEAAADAGAAHGAMVPQGVLLGLLGIAARAEALARDLTGDARQSHLAAFRRLTHADEMGTLFKALAIHPRGMAPPPGFDPWPEVS
ncbi:class I SAM-dependent methyltransferase [Alkalilacustris brevis]|uniref:class I SAM-dependent methyltransferase n=1 Tax=Alkalilacustris brevis TaxID=2026338 RepID=UPI000E0D5E54|nr:SAM-dependent methyltransferase [Alkalilacustris brevis]